MAKKKRTSSSADEMIEGLRSTSLRSVETLNKLAQLGERDSHRAAAALYKIALNALAVLQGDLAMNCPDVVRELFTCNGEPVVPALIPLDAPGKGALNVERWLALIGAPPVDVKPHLGKGRTVFMGTEVSALASRLLMVLRRIAQGTLEQVAPEFREAAKQFARIEKLPNLTGDTADQWWRAALWILKESFGPDWTEPSGMNAIAARPSVKNEGKDGMQRRRKRSHAQSDLKRAFDALVWDRIGTGGR